MKKRKYTLFVILTAIGSLSLNAQLKLTDDNNGFAIVNETNITSIYHDKADFEVVKVAADLLAKDIDQITGKKPTVFTNEPTTKTAIIIGTVGSSDIIDELIRSNRIDPSQLSGEWEKFLFKTIDKPFPGVEQALVIAGSDRRGTAYGVFELSKTLGVSPWYWWADVPVRKKSSLSIEATDWVSKSPSVKYRGVFLNDEDWGLKPWASKNMDPEIKDIGPKTYEKVFELLLRLKANMVAPAMHECTGAFFKYAENKKVADKYAIMITTSHAEPLLYNNTTEWQKWVNGEWDYVHNKANVLSVMDNRVAEAAPYENLYTIGMRGIHDTGMKDVPEGYTKAGVLEKVINEERNILTTHIQKPIEEIPQIFVPYKEVLDIYESGMKLPEDITIVWPDDNYGYIKKLSNRDEKHRNGGSGVYYHISYLGWPNDYLWLNTTPPALIYAEMQKAFSQGSKKYWLLNVGDIKPGELGMQFFLDMAWDINAFNFENVNDYQVKLLTSIFGESHQSDLQYILDRYYYHGFTRKPEYMTWDWRWNSIFGHAEIKDTEFSFINYQEAETRLNEYVGIAEKAERILNQLPESLKPSFYELVYYPVKGASLYNHKMLVAQKNRWYATQGRALTNQLADDVIAYQDSLAFITETYNNQLNGKWNGMMTAPGFVPKPQLPPTQRIDLPVNGQVGLFVEGNIADDKNQHELPVFDSEQANKHYFELYNKGNKPYKWKATTTKDWIQLEKEKGTVEQQERVWVSVDWDKFEEINATGEIKVYSGELAKTILITAKRPMAKEQCYTPSNGVISINPVNYHNKKENGDIQFKKIPGLGYSNSSLQLGSSEYEEGQGSYVEYDFYSEDDQEITINTYMLPLFAKDRSHSTRYGVQVDDLNMIVHSNDVKEYSKEWAANVIRNGAINSTSITLKGAGKHSLKIIAIDPGMVIQKIVIDFGGLKQSYLGPKDQKL